jgi:hypothetical protein
MSEVPKYDLRGANIGNLADTVQGDQIHNTAPSPEMARALTEIKQLLQDLQQQYPDTNPVTLPEVLDGELETWQHQDPSRYQTIFNWFNVLFTGGKETVKILFPWAGIPIEIALKLYEIWKTRWHKEDEV